MNKLEYTVLPTCPVCGEVTYKGEDLKILIKNATKKGYLTRLDDDEKVGDWAYDENDDLIPEKVDMIARAWQWAKEVEE